MTVLEAASAGVRDMADGSLRITLEFDPRFAKDAYALFGARGTPVAVAALKTGHAAKSDEPIAEKPPRERLGELAWWAVQRCKEPRFREWLTNRAATEAEARDVVCQVCGVESRKDIDGNPAAVRSFNEHIRKPYSEWLAKQGDAQ